MSGNPNGDGAENFHLGFLLAQLHELVGACMVFLRQFTNVKCHLGPLYVFYHGTELTIDTGMN